MNENNNDVKIVAFDAPKSSTKRTLKNKPRGPLKPQEKISTESEITNENKTGIKKFSNLFLIIGIIALVVIIISVCLAVLLSKKNKKKNNKEGNGTSEFPSNPSVENDQLLKPIYKFNNTVGDLKRINVQQTSHKNMTVNGKTTEFLVHRNTTYDIYIMAVESPDEKNKNFYTNKYTASINVVKECYSFDNENCEQQNYIDFSNEDNEEKSNLRKLQEVTDLKGIPLPICLFNFTDNDAITSFKCPETLPDSKKYEMILDLYFFRPPAIERPVMDNPLRTVTIETTPIDNGKFTRERNYGVCDVNNPLNTRCTTDMNTTTDSYDNLVTYDEVAFSNFTSDENNSYIKNKVTHLKDITDRTKYLNKETHKNQLDYMIKKLEPYIKYDEYFSTEDFQELHSIIKGNSTNGKKSIRRNLDEKFTGIDPYVKEENLFYEKIDGVEITLNLKNDIGIDKIPMTASSILSLDKMQKELASKSEETHLNKLLEELIILSKAGNSLANELYEQIEQKLANITNDINVTIASLNNLIEYEDLVSIFDSTFSIENLTKLPVSFISQSEHLFILLNKILIDTNEIISYKDTLKTNIYNFIYESHNLVNGLLEKIKELGDKLGSRKGELTEIATYYLNYTSTSYNTIVSKAEDILKNYYIKEKELISDKINSILKPFEENVKNSVEKEIGIIENIKNKLENKAMTIRLSNEEDTKNVILNLNKSINIISDIISTYKNKIESSLDLKSSGYFINDDEITSFQTRINETIKKANENAQKFDNDNLIDKVYDEKMGNFRQNFTELKNYMNNKRDENFFMSEEVLKNDKFTEYEKANISSYLKTIRSTIVNEILNENNEYKTEITNKINTLVLSKKERLNQLIKNVDAFFSKPSLEKLSNLYKDTFDNSFELIKNQINSNKQLSYQYLDYLYQVLSNNSELAPYIDPYVRYKYKMGQTVYYWSRYHYTYVTNLSKYITNKQITKAYQTKYNIYSANFDSSEIYINNQMYIDLSKEYKSLIIKIKSLLQSVKNNKFSDKYGDQKELTFINDNIRIIDNLYTRLDEYFSEILYNNDYLVKFNTFKQNEIQEIQKIKQELIKKNKLLTDNFTISNDKTNDFCSSYNKVVTHTCTNGAVGSITEGDSICLNLWNYSNNHNQLSTLSIKNENNLQKLETEFNDFYSSLNQNINEYNNVITSLKNEIAYFENNTINIKGELNNLNEINKYINKILNQKYGDILIKDSYSFYQKNIGNKFENFLNSINEKWIESFEKTESEIELNKNKFKNHVKDFYVIAYIYNDLLRDDIIYDYTDSIIDQQKNEFNYTISYYYNYLYTSVNRTYQYIIGKILSYDDSFNNILDYRKNQVIEKYNEILQIIKNSENNALSEKNQINLLLVPITNFFSVNDLTNDKIEYVDPKLESIAVSMLKKGIQIGEEYSQTCISARLYLENSENGKIVQELTDSINRVTFAYLNQENFKELIDNYIILDQENLIGCVNSIISKSTSEISTDYQRIRETYIDQLENEIKVYFTKESLTKNIYLIYKNGINNLDEDSRNAIVLKVNEILDVISDHIKSESNRLSTTISYNSNYETINETIKYYKEETFNKVKNEMTNLFETLKENIYNRIYTNHVEKGLNQYLSEIKDATSNKTIFNQYKALGDSYEIGEEINKIAEDLSAQYKFITKEIIENSILKSDYYKALNLEEIEKLINEKIESAFTSYLLPALKNYAIYDKKDSSFSSYDLSNDIKNNINSKINENIDKIKDIMSKTKGENYEFQLDYHKDWKIPDFSNIRRVILKMGDNFEVFFVHEIEDEKKMFNNSFKNNIKENFNKMLDNFITSFGDKFFERVIEYNLLNKIDNLYNNFEYSYIQSYFYFNFMLSSFKVVIQKDLKYKLVSLNDIDLIIEQNKDIILKTFASKIDDFIKETSKFLIDKYSSYMTKDEHNIEFTNMSEELKILIIANILDSENYMENEYKNSLLNHLKSPLIDKFEIYLKAICDDLLISIQEYRQDLSSKIKQIDTIDTEEDLIEINEKINSTLEQINSYNKHFQFEVSENIKQFLTSYGDNSIKPCFNGIINLINEATKDIMFQNINTNSENYEKKLNIILFNNKANESYSFLKETYITPINKQISLYDSQNYAKNLKIKKDNIKSRRRRYLENSNTEDDKKEDYRERVADKPLDDTFSSLLTTADKVQEYIDSFVEFSKYDKLIKNYFEDVDLAAKNSSNLINDYKFDENTTNSLKNKLEHLKNISLSYYNNVNNSFSIVRNYIKNSIIEINTELKKCANVTYETFANNYKEILNNEYSNTINKKYSSTNKDNQIEFNSTTQNGRVFFETTISELQNYSEFKFEIKYDEVNNIKKPMIFASITNKNIPREMTIKNYEKVGNNGRYGHINKVIFNDANYSSIINFDTKSTNVNVTTLVKFEEYTYTTTPFTKLSNSSCRICITMGLTPKREMCFEDECGEEISNDTAVSRIYVDSKVKNSFEILLY